MGYQQNAHKCIKPFTFKLTKGIQSIHPKNTENGFSSDHTGPFVTSATSNHSNHLFYIPIIIPAKAHVASAGVNRCIKTYIESLSVASQSPYIFISLTRLSHSLNHSFPLLITNMMCSSTLLHQACRHMPNHRDHSLPNC